MNLSTDELDTLKYEAECTGMSYITLYKDRYNVAITGTYRNKVTLILRFVSMIKYLALEGEVDEAQNYENIVEWLLNAREDNLGNHYIWY